MRHLLPLAGLVALLLVASAAHAQGRTSQMGNFEIQDLVIAIDYLPVDDRPTEAGSEATVRVSGFWDRGPILPVILSTTDEPNRREAIQLRRVDDGEYVGTGDVPPPEAIRSMGLLTDDGTLVLLTGPLEEGEAEVPATLGDARTNAMIEISPTPRYRDAYRAAHAERAKAFSDAVRWIFHRR